MAEADTSAVGLAVQIAQQHQSGVSAIEIQSSLQNWCQAQGMDEPAAQARIQEVSCIWSAMSTVLQRPGLSTTSMAQTTKDTMPTGADLSTSKPSQAAHS
jgi:hypothetical protein